MLLLYSVLVDLVCHWRRDRGRRVGGPPRNLPEDEPRAVHVGAEEGLEARIKSYLNNYLINNQLIIIYLEGGVCAHALPEHLGGHVADGADALVGGAVVDVAPVALEADGEAEVGDGDGAVALDLKVSCVASYAK